MTDEDNEETALEDWMDIDEPEELDDEASEELERIQVKLGLTEDAAPRMIDGRYEILGRQGQGGMGVVYHAHDTRLDRAVALKLVRSRPFRDEDRLRERLEREAKALAKLDGRDHVVAVYDVGRHKDRIYFTMPYIEGSDLREWQDAAQHRSVDEIVGVYLQAARGLAEAHELGIVHRDFKPGNVLLRAGDNRVMVADFGIAEAVSKSDTAPEGIEAATTDERLTMTGAVLGTLPYVAPERIPGGDRPSVRGTPASDQFSFCVALWEALAGKVPFAAGKTADMLAALERGPTGEAEIPPWLRPVLRRGLAYDPDARFPSMRALIRAIEGRRHRRKRLALVAGGLALVLGLVSAGVVLLSPTPADDPRSTCSVFAESAAKVWSADRRGSFARHRVYAPETTDHVIAQLDALMQRWVSEAEATCVEGYAPEPDDPARQCLDPWLHVAADYVDLLMEISDPATAAKAGELVDRLLPSADADFCALLPPKLVALEVWSATESARAAAVLGAGEPALVRANEAIDRANGLLRGRTHTAELAEAYSARAEVWARAQQFEAALRDFESSEAHAHGSGYIEGELRTQALWAKVRVLATQSPYVYEQALGELERAHRLLPVVTSAHQRGQIEAELEDAAGFIESERDDYAKAVGHHQRAAKLLEHLARPVLLAKALNNLGVAQQSLEQWDEARRTYWRARGVLAEARVRPGHSTSLEVELNLGILEAELDRSEGFDHLNIVIEHSSGARQLKALTKALALAVNRDDEERTRRFAELVRERVAVAPLDTAQGIEANYSAAVALIGLGDPRGDAMFTTLPQVPGALVSPELGLGLRRAHVRALEERDRCDDAATVLAELDDYARAHSLDDDDFRGWRAKRETAACKLARFVEAN